MAEIDEKSMKDKIFLYFWGYYVCAWERRKVYDQR